MHVRWRLSHIRGYLALGLIEEAAAELALLPDEALDELPVLGMRAAVLQAQQRWPELTMVAAELVRQQPENPGWWVTFAYATRRSACLRDAEAILRQAEQRHPNDATIQFNLGCYACQRGELTQARERVRRAVALDEQFGAAAQLDPDLEPLRALHGPAFWQD